MTTKWMDPSLVQEFRERLREARRRLLRTVTTTDEELATLEGHQAGTGEDVATELVTAVLSRLEGREKHELDDVDAARMRLDAGRFGVCEGCSGTIPLARLRAMPTARYCLDCQSRREPSGR